MADYFSISANGNLLPEDVRCRDDIALLASEAEWQVKNYYSEAPLDSRGTALWDSRVVTTGLENLTTNTADPVVMLRYYKADADELTSTAQLAFKAAMQRAIARLIVLNAEREDREADVKTEWRGRRRIEYFGGANGAAPGFPGVVQRMLAPYDARTPNFAI